MTVYREPPTGSNMGTRLVTVATFDQVAQAQMAADAIRAAGIGAVVADAEVVSMDWLLGQAVGGIKVQVRGEDAERAVAELNWAFGERGERLGAEGEPAADDEEGDEPPEPDEQPEPAPAPAETRDGYARRLVTSAVFGLVFPPLWFYAVYLFLNAAFGEGSLSETGRNKLFVGTFVLALGVPAAFAILYLFGI